MLPNDLHTFLLLVGGPAALMWIVSHLLERNNRFQALPTQEKSWFILALAVVLAFLSYGLAAWDAGVTISITPQLIYTIILSGITNWMSGNFYHAALDSQNDKTTTTIDITASSTTSVPPVGSTSSTVPVGNG